jgi:glycosyltransferase involved in cell wall biosynthesis
MRLCIITTIPATQYHFMAPQVALAVKRGHEVHLVCGADRWVTPQALGERYGVPVHVVTLRRAVTPLADIRALVALRGLFRRLRPDVVHYSTPKASLLGALAAWSARVPRRVYTNRGLLAADQPGLKGVAWRMVERVICRLSHAVTCNSESNRRLMVQRKLCDPAKLRVLGKGSSHGVDAQGRFNPANSDPARLESLKAQLLHTASPDRSPQSALGERGARIIHTRRAQSASNPRSAIVFLFVGRLARDKGFAELAGAWALAHRELPESRLVIVGPAVEPWNGLSRGILAALKADANVTFTGPVDDAAPYYALADIVVLPSYREGFPNVPLEAAAMEKPCIVTNALGCVDAVKDGETGVVVPVRDAGALARAMVRLARDPALRARMGRAGREWVVRDFVPERIAEEWLALVQAGMSIE